MTSFFSKGLHRFEILIRRHFLNATLPSLGGCYADRTIWHRNWKKSLNVSDKVRCANLENEWTLSKKWKKSRCFLSSPSNFFMVKRRVKKTTNDFCSLTGRMRVVFCSRASSSVAAEWVSNSLGHTFLSPFYCFVLRGQRSAKLLSKSGLINPDMGHRRVISPV